jgi:hypothetical protein
VYMRTQRNTYIILHAYTYIHSMYAHANRLVTTMRAFVQTAPCLRTPSHTVALHNRKDLTRPTHNQICFDWSGASSCRPPRAHVRSETRHLECHHSLCRRQVSNTRGLSEIHACPSYSSHPSRMRHVCMLRFVHGVVHIALEHHVVTLLQ